MDHMFESEELEYQEWLYQEHQEWMYHSLQQELDIWDIKRKEQDSAIDELPF